MSRPVAFTAPTNDGSKRVSNEQASSHLRSTRAVPERPRNRLLASLPSPTWERLAPYVRHALLIPGQTLVEAARPAARVYFPNSGVLSLTMHSADGTSVEVGMIGREGTSATLETLSSGVPHARVLVQLAGNACWLPQEVMRSEFLSDSALREWMLRYWEVLGAQASHGVLCNRLHSVEQRLARWILTTQERVGNDEIEITHEYIAQALGARRSGVTIALGHFQDEGLIGGTRGKITVLDSPRLGEMACSCYSALRRHFAHFEGVQQSAIVQQQSAVVLPTLPLPRIAGKPRIAA